MVDVTFVGKQASYDAGSGARFKRGDTLAVSEEVAARLARKTASDGSKLFRVAKVAPAAGKTVRTFGKKAGEDDAPPPRLEGLQAIPGVPPFPAAGFSEKKALIAYAKEHLGIDLPQTKALKTLNREAAARYEELAAEHQNKNPDTSDLLTPGDVEDDDNEEGDDETDTGATAQEV